MSFSKEERRIEAILDDTSNDGCLEETVAFVRKGHVHIGRRYNLHGEGWRYWQDQRVSIPIKSLHRIIKLVLLDRYPEEVKLKQKKEKKT